MAILIDPPLWPAHGTLWSHLVSDDSYAELHEFAALMPLPRRGFDLDHYDVPASLFDRAVALGAEAVGSRDVVHRLRASGLRIRQADREAIRPQRRRQYLLGEWSALGRSAGLADTERAIESWRDLGVRLIERWNEPHRSYHDEQHLEYVLHSLDQLATQGERIAPATLLAAWFHDAVYTGRGPDERDSARLAVASLEAQRLDPALVQQVGEFVIATAPALATRSAPVPLAHLLDADLSIFAASPSRYRRYTTGVRAEYAHVGERDFREGRAGILQNYLAHPAIYRTPLARRLWEDRARENLSREIWSLTE